MLCYSRVFFSLVSPFITLLIMASNGFYFLSFFFTQNIISTLGCRGKIRLPFFLDIAVYEPRYIYFTIKIKKPTVPYVV
jgi:hypothetical protein